MISGLRLVQQPDYRLDSVACSLVPCGGWPACCSPGALSLCILEIATETVATRPSILWKTKTYLIDVCTGGCLRKMWCYQQHGCRGILQVKIWASTNEIWAFQIFKIGFCNFLVPSNFKILFSDLTFMDLSLKAWKRKLVNWAGIVGFWRKKLWNNARIKIWPVVK